MIGPFTSIEHGYVRAFRFTGRATRAEFWFFEAYYVLALAFLMYFDLVNAVRIIDRTPVMTITDLSGMMTFWSVWFMVLHLPARLALHVRRLNDAGQSGLWAILSVLPVAGRLMLPVLGKPSDGDMMGLLHGTVPVHHSRYWGVA